MRITTRRCYECKRARERGERDREKEKLTRSLDLRRLACRSDSRRLSAHERLSPVRGSECGLSLGRPRGEVTSSFLSAAPFPAPFFPLSRVPRRSIGGRLARSSGIVTTARRITCHRSIANTARRDGAGPMYVVCHIHHTGNE